MHIAQPAVALTLRTYTWQLQWHLFVKPHSLLHGRIYHQVLAAGLSSARSLPLKGHRDSYRFKIHQRPDIYHKSRSQYTWHHRRMKSLDFLDPTSLTIRPPTENKCFRRVGRTISCWEWTLLAHRPRQDSITPTKRIFERHIYDFVIISLNA